MAGAVRPPPGRKPAAMGRAGSMQAAVRMPIYKKGAIRGRAQGAHGSGPCVAAPPAQGGAAAANQGFVAAF